MAREQVRKEQAASMNRQVGRALRSAPAMRTTSPWTERVGVNIWRHCFGDTVSAAGGGFAPPSR